MRYVPAFIVLFLLFGPGVSAQTANIHEHPNGLRLAAPQGAAVTQTANGYVVGRNPPGIQRGSGLNVVVEVTDGDGGLRHGKSREVAPGKTFLYEVTRIPGEGSGGDEYTLKACLKQAKRSVCLRQSKLSEGHEPAFEAWTIADGVSLK